MNSGSHRFWLIVVALTGMAAASSAPTNITSTGMWYQKAQVGMEVGPTGAQFGDSDPSDRRYCAHFDGREIVRRAVAAHSEYLVLWARDGDYAYYNSQLLPKAPGLGERDPLQEATDEARQHRLPVIAYCVVQQGGHYLKAHPEWEMRGADHKPLGRFCYNSGYLEAMKQIIAEQAAYSIDGFHIDMVDQGFGPPYGCWCDSCREQFQKEYKQPMPNEATWDEAWDKFLEFRYRTSDRFENALRTHIRSTHPRLTVDFNYHGNPPFSFEVGQRPVQHARNGDFITGESGVWGFSALAVGLNAAFYRAAVPQQRVQVAIQRGVRMYHDQTTRPLNDLRWELLTLLAHDAFVTIVDKTGLEGTLDPIAYARIGTAFEEAKAKRAEFGYRPLADVGLYFSSRTRDWVGRANPAEYFQSFQGAHKTMVYEHIPYCVVLDENLSLEGLKHLPVVVLPNVSVLSDGEIALLRQYVEEGGQLLVTGQSGTRGWRGEKRDRSGLQELVGARRVRTIDSTDNWVRLSATTDETKLLSEGIAHTRDWHEANGNHGPVPFLVRGPATVYEPWGAMPIGDLIQPQRTRLHEEHRYPEDWPLSPDTVVGPAILLNQLGRGRVLTMATSPDWATASDHHTVEARKLLANAVHLLHPKPRVQIVAPATVEAVVTDDPRNRTLRVHLLNYNAPPQTTPPKNRPYLLPGLIEDPLLFRATLHFSERVNEVRTFNTSTRLKQRGHQVEVLVEDLHDVIQCHY